MAKKLDERIFKSSKGDVDAWIQRASRPDGKQYYEYVMFCIDDVMAVSHNALQLMEKLGEG